MFSWFIKKAKEPNTEMESIACADLSIPLATVAKKMSIENLDARIKRAEKAIFDEACKFINEQIEKGCLAVGFDAFSAVYHIDDTLDKNSIFVAIDDCINHLSTFGYTVKQDGERYLIINWQ